MRSTPSAASSKRKSHKVSHASILTLWKLRTSLMRLFERSVSLGALQTVCHQESRMRLKPTRGCALAISLGVPLAMFSVLPPLHAQGGEPQYFAIRGAKVVPVSGPPIEGATIVVSRGIITAVGKDAAIPAEAWVIDGKGLTVYPGLVDAFTDVGIPAAAPSGGEGGGPRRPQE